MFSGIVEELGVVAQRLRRGRIACLEIKAERVTEDAKIGDSIAVNGVCLTVVKTGRGALVFEAMPETLTRSNLGMLSPGDKVNLERALKLGDRVSGHFVLGHVDTTGRINKKIFKAGNQCFEIAFPAAFSSYVIPRGSVAVDGISLTIAEKRPASVAVYLIPHTFKNTTLGFKGPSSIVNLEFDILAKRQP